MSAPAEWNPKAIRVSSRIFVLTASTRVQPPVPEQPPPDQPANVEPVAGLAVRTTVVPYGYDAVQVVPQSMPAGDDVTVPEPVPLSVHAEGVVPWRRRWARTRASSSAMWNGFAT